MISGGGGDRNELSTGSVVADRLIREWVPELGV